MRKVLKNIKREVRNIINDKGSVVIEASISLTVFMFLVITLLTFVNACIVQARVGVALHEAAKEFSEYGYVYSLFGFNDEQKKYYEELSGYRMDIDDAIGAMGDVKDSLDTIAHLDPTSDSAWDDWNSSLDTLEESGQKYEKIYENIKADPGEYFLGMGKVALNEGFEFFKGTVAGQFIAKGLMYKHLKEESKQDPNLFLRRHGVKDGLSGLKLYNSTVFTNGTDDIALICQYKIRMVRLLNIDVEYEVCQLAKTKAWTGNVLVRDKDNDPSNNDSSEEGSTDDAGESDSSEEGDPDDPGDGGAIVIEEDYDTIRKDMVDKYGASVVRDVEYNEGKPKTRQEFDDLCKKWQDATWMNTKDDVPRDSLGKIIWPENNGAIKESEHEVILQPGMVLDRYGGTGGEYLGNPEDSFDERSLPYKDDDKAKNAYHKYQVVRPIPAVEGTIAPYFGGKGGGTQYYTSMTVEELLEQGYIVEITEKKHL